MSRKIENIWAYVTSEVAEDGTISEAIPAVGQKGGMIMPLVCDDETKVELLRPFAAQVAARGVAVRLIKFTGFEELGAVEPAPAPAAPPKPKMQIVMPDGHGDKIEVVKP